MTGTYVLHENSPWVEPLNAAFAELGLPHEEWFLNEARCPSTKRRRTASSTTA